MSVPSKPRTPPPPYREPLPGSTFASTLAHRPSVITQAPKREIISNRENKDTIANGALTTIMCVIIKLKLILPFLQLQNQSP